MNTGRPYSPEGQIIEYRVVQMPHHVEIHFHDKTRGISGVVHHEGELDDTPAKILMDAYDHGRYTETCVANDYHKFIDLFTELGIGFTESTRKDLKTIELVKGAPLVGGYDDFVCEFQFTDTNKFVEVKIHEEGVTVTPSPDSGWEVEYKGQTFYTVPGSTCDGCYFDPPKGICRAPDLDCTFLDHPPSDPYRSVIFKLKEEK